mmetsp:Transcript_30816/g.100345  ORF Transcript_30816/g.100345 Transcript_30816/m.100345 type:complete len:356 (-) Transcript_30816:190-1257(-)
MFRDELSLVHKVRARQRCVAAEVHLHRRREPAQVILGRGRHSGSQKRRFAEVELARHQQQALVRRPLSAAAQQDHGRGVPAVRLRRESVDDAERFLCDSGRNHCAAQWFLPLPPPPNPASAVKRRLRARQHLAPVYEHYALLLENLTAKVPSVVVSARKSASRLSGSSPAKSISGVYTPGLKEAPPLLSLRSSRSSANSAALCPTHRRNDSCPWTTDETLRPSPPPVTSTLMPCVSPTKESVNRTIGALKAARRLLKAGSSHSPRGTTRTSRPKIVFQTSGAVDMRTSESPRMLSVSPTVRTSGNGHANALLVPSLRRSISISRSSSLSPLKKKSTVLKSVPALSCGARFPPLSV